MKLFVALFCVGIASALPVSEDRQQLLPNGPVTLTHPGSGISGNTEVDVLCREGKVKLMLKTDATAFKQAKIEIGASGSPACAIGPAPYSNALFVQTTKDDTCGRTFSRWNVRNVYQWSVKVTEYLQLTPIERVFESFFTVQCDVNFSGPDETHEFEQPDGVNEGTSTFSDDVTFRLDKNLAISTSRRWVLELTPTSVASLGGLSYTIENITAFPTDSTTRINIIELGCITDTFGTTVVTNPDGNLQLNTINISAFRFPSHPETSITFSATVKSCVPSTPGGVCAGVKDAQNCAASTRSRRSLEGGFKFLTASVTV